MMLLSVDLNKQFWSKMWKQCTITINYLSLKCSYVYLQSVNFSSTGVLNNFICFPQSNKRNNKKYHRPKNCHGAVLGFNIRLPSHNLNLNIVIFPFVQRSVGSIWILFSLNVYIYFLVCLLVVSLPISSVVAALGLLQSLS